MEVLGFLDYGFKDLIETFIIAMILYYMYRWIRGTFAIQAALGLVLIIIIYAAVSALGLRTINFMLRSIMDVGVLAIIVLFQPEIRKLLYRLGQNTQLDRFFARSNSDVVINEVVDAIRNMARIKTGAIIVFARSSSLQDLVDIGTPLDAKVNNRLLETIFNKETPLHDGAVIIRNNRIVAASCYLPISQNPNISSVFGTRHRAAVGVSETNNVFVIVLSEETGRISIARNGALTSGLTVQKLRTEMEKELSNQVGDEGGISFSGKSGQKSSKLNLDT